MTKKIIPTLLFWMIFSTLHLCAVDGSRLELRSAAFYHSSKLFRDIYGKASVDFQIQAATPLFKHFEVWVNIDTFSKHGHSIGFKDPTKVNITNCSAGLTYVYRLNCFQQLYVGIGPSFANIHIDNHSRFKHNKEFKSVIGGVVKAGLYYTLTDSLYLDLFVDYLYQPARFDNHVDIGGVKPGIGIGAIF